MSTLKKATKTMIVKSHTIGNRTSADAAPDEHKGRAGKKPSSLDSLEGRDSCGASTSLRSLPNTHRPQLSPLDVSEFGQVTSLSYGEQDEPDASGDAHSYWDEPVHPSSIALWRNDVEMAIPDVGVDEVPLSPARRLVSLPLPSSPSVTSSASMRAQYHASPQPSSGLPDNSEYSSYGPDAYLWPADLPLNRHNKPGVEISRPVSFIRFPSTYSQDSAPSSSAVPRGLPLPGAEIISSISSASSYSSPSRYSAPSYSSPSHYSSPSRYSAPSYYSPSPPPPPPPPSPAPTEPKFDKVVYDSMAAMIEKFASRVRDNDPSLWGEEAAIIVNRVRRVKFENKVPYERSLALLMDNLKDMDNIDIEMFLSDF
ncbi:hypothetical protein EYR36_000247 [Pleurotus pulmonarius]|nr:hypothetical protein EYR36_000247 [Pleurotus pulmonarius]